MYSMAGAYTDLPEKTEWFLNLLGLKKKQQDLK